MSKKVFISYAREDVDMIRRINTDLETKGFTTWLDEKDLLPGQNWRVVIPREIRESDYCLMMFSSLSVVKRGFVQAEQKIALGVVDEMPESAVFIIPVRLDECEIPYSLEDRHYVDMFPDYDRGFEIILKALNA